jgi:hypothetical protein
MNNALIENLNEPEEFDRTPWLRARQGEIMNILSAIDEVMKSKSWQTLNSLVFEGVTENLEKRLTNEAKKDTPNSLELARINGQLVWAKKFSNLSELAKVFKTELDGIKNQLKDL